MNPEKMVAVLPIIHLNGTSREALLNALESAYGAITEAMDKLCECAPNGRDYYPAPGRMELALAQHRLRGEHLKAVRDSIQAEVDGIVAQESL